MVEKARQVLLGLWASERMGLVSRTVSTVTKNSSRQLVQEFSDLLKASGCARRKYRMVLREDATADVQAPERVPLALQEPLRDGLKWMEGAGIIADFSAPTDWVGPLVIVKKKD